MRKMDLLGLRGLEGSEIMAVLTRAAAMKGRIDSPEARDRSLDKAAAVTLFYENSTRTRMSFTLAAEYLGMRINDLGVSASSASKGESLVATAQNLDHMGVDIMILRHSMTGAAHLLARNVRASVINGGDGANEHPTQALLDLMTIYEQKGGFKGLKVAIIGDVRHSRVARSNVFGLTALGAEVTLAGPATLTSKGMEALAPGVRVVTDVRKAVRGADVVMGLRIQLERQKAAAFPDLREYTRFFGVDGDVLSHARPEALIMHPGPVNRGIEMTPEIIDHPRSFILEQTKNGVAVRMAVLSLIMERRAGL